MRRPKLTTNSFKERLTTNLEQLHARLRFTYYVLQQDLYLLPLIYRCPKQRLHCIREAIGSVLYIVALVTVTVSASFVTCHSLG